MEWIELKGWGGIIFVNKNGDVLVKEHEVKCFNGNRTIYEHMKKFTVCNNNEVTTLNYKKKQKTISRYRLIRAYYNNGILK